LKAVTARERRIGLAVKRLQMRHHRALMEALAPLDVSLVQWDALRHLDENPSASLHELALLTFQTDQSFGSLASRMVDRGLIERVAGPGRAVRHRLTAKGLQVRQAGEVLVDGVLAQSLADLTPAQFDAFDKTLAVLLAGSPDGKELEQD
jgi:DNA-binding MarR family transcriptional regulator